MSLQEQKEAESQAKSGPFYSTSRYVVFGKFLINLDLNHVQRMNSVLENV